jgi:hypothetical protein
MSEVRYASAQPPNVSTLFLRISHAERAVDAGALLEANQPLW